MAAIERILIVCLAAFIAACSKNDDSQYAKPIICPEHVQAWFSESKRIFLDETNIEDIRQFVTLLASWTAKTECSTSDTNLREIDQQLAEFVQETADKNLQTREALWLVHQLTFSGEFALFGADKTESITNNDIAKSLQSFVALFVNLEASKIAFYTAEKSEQVLAYYRSTESQRMYVVFNLSYDFVPVPFPLGFMASTKIKIWRTDDMQMREFVTKGELTLRPLTAAVILVR